MDPFFTTMAQRQVPRTEPGGFMGYTGQPRQTTRPDVATTVHSVGP